MRTTRSGLVDLVRDFLLAHRSLRGLVARFREGSLRFEEVAQLVGDTEESPLFRLKERCHSLFRNDREGGGSMRREALFDLAVGSLFHEAMKFRENLYQQEVYGPKVKDLRSSAGCESGRLFQEFERILFAVGVRLAEALQETEALLALTRDQLRVLLADHRDEGLIARYLVERPALVSEVFSDGLEELLAEIHGDAARGFAVAARSYLESAFFEEAIGALEQARAHASRDGELVRLTLYAQGMQAFLGGRYAECFEHIGAWLDAGPSEDEAPFLSLAQSALSRVDHLVAAPELKRVHAAAPGLAGRLAELTGRPERPEL
jgi:tetratricopeptide (TPR) repeat protein